MSEDTRGRATWRRFSVLVGAVYLTLLLLVLLWPTPVTRPFDRLLHALDRRLPGSVGALEFCSNIALFLPAGALLAAMLPRRWRLLAVPIGAAASIAFELAQALLLRERVAALSDIVANTVGTLFGVVAVMVWDRRRLR